MLLEQINGPTAEVFSDRQSGFFHLIRGGLRLHLLRIYTVAHRPDCSLGAILHIQLPQYCFHMHLHRRLAYFKITRDDLIRGSDDQKA